MRADKVHTRFVDEHADAADRRGGQAAAGRYFQAAARAAARRRQAGAQVDAVDPLAVLAFGKATRDRPRRDAAAATRRRARVPVPRADAGHDRQPRRSRRATPSRAGQPLLIMDAMKMQHEIKQPGARLSCGASRSSAGETVYEGHALLFVEEADVEVKGAAAEETIDLDHIRPDLAEYSRAPRA